MTGSNSTIFHQINLRFEAARPFAMLQHCCIHEPRIRAIGDDAPGGTSLHQYPQVFPIFHPQMPQNTTILLINPKTFTFF